MTSIDLLNDLWNIDGDVATVNRGNIWQNMSCAEGNGTTMITTPPSSHTTIDQFHNIGSSYNHHAQNNYQYYLAGNYTTSAFPKTTPSISAVHPVSAYASSPNSLSKINSNSSNSSSMSSMSSYLGGEIDKLDLNSMTPVSPIGNSLNASTSTSVVPPVNNVASTNTSKLEDKKPVNTQLYKTELCDSYMKFSYCPYGNKCQFAHGENELKRVSRPANWRSKPCANWTKFGSCRYGNRCCFKHSD